MILRISRGLYSLMAVVLALASAFPRLAHASCTSLTAETCGNGVDDDCDGATDEGCSLLGTLVSVPYKFATQGKQAPPFQWGTWGAELRPDPYTPLTYGQYMDYRWLLGLSSHAAFCRVNFLWFDTETTYDYLHLGSWSGTGQLLASPGVTGGPGVWSDWFSGASGVLPAAKFYTDLNNASRPAGAILGFETNSMQCIYVDYGATPTYWTVPLNTGVDGVLLHEKDDAYFQVSLPAGRELHINLDHMGNAAQNFDLAIQTSLTIPSLTPCSTNPACCPSPSGSCSVAATGEYLDVLLDPVHSRTIALRVHAKQGSGRFRLFLASPVNTNYCEGETLNPIDVGVESQTSYDWEQLRINEFLRGTVAGLLAATDGQYKLDSLFFIENGVSWWVPACAYEIFLDNDDDCGDGCGACTPGATHHFPSWYVELPRWFWRGEVKSCGYSNSSPRQVSEVMVHEWGHYMFHLNDQYGGASQLKMCTHSLMAGAGGMTYINGDYRYFEFCTSKDHDKTPQSGAPYDGTSPDWNQIVSVCTSMSAPNASGTLTSSDFSQLVNMVNNGLNTNMVWYF